MGLDFFMALWWDFWQIPYFKVFESKGNKVVKVFNQKVVNPVKGSNIALIDKPNKLCWWITDDYFVHKSRIIFYCNINNGIPLHIEETKELSGNIIIKEVTKRAIKIDSKKQKDEKNSGLPIKKVEIEFPPPLLYQLIEAHFVQEVLAQPKSKWEELKWVFIVAIIAGAFLLWQFMGTKVVSGGAL